MTTDPHVPSAYPARWEADVLLADGGAAQVRPVRPDDAPRLLEFWSRLSEQSIYFRFFSVKSGLTDADLARMTVVDQWVRGSLVVLIGRELVAVGAWEGTPNPNVNPAPDQAPVSVSVSTPVSVGGGRSGPEAPPPGVARPGPHAEVAFLVEDAHQGRGVGSVLLEHLAAAAWERGVRRFDADVLAENRQMVKVFIDAGYTVSRAWDSGAVRLSFEIAPTESSVGVMRDREHHAEAASISRLLKPRSIAVIGASRTRGSIGDAVLRHLLAGDFDGPVYPVNPAAAAGSGSVGSVRAYASVTDVPRPVDLAVVCVPPSEVPAVVEDCAKRGVWGLVVLTDLRDDAADRALAANARAHGMRVVGPASLGIQNLTTGLNASLSARMPPVGRLGCYSQSGPLGGALLEAAAERGVGLSVFVSAGDRADVSGNDLLQYWEEDPDTDVVFWHVETFGNPRKFARLARRVGRRTPVVVATSHRSRLDESLLRQAGVIGVDRVSQGLDVALLLINQPLPAGRRVAVVGDSRALVRLTGQAAEAAGLAVEQILLPGGSEPETFTAALVDAAARSDALIATVVQLPPSSPGPVAAGAAAAAATVDIPVLATVLGTAPPAELGSIPAYPSPEGAVAALTRAVAYAEWLAEPVGTVPTVAARGDRARALVVESNGRLDDGRAAALVACYGIDVAPAVVAATADEAVAAADRLGWPVVLKARSRPYRHRPELGGQRLDIADAAALRQAWASLTAQLGGRSPVVVQKMAAAGVPVVVGSVEHPRYGPLVSFGLAGPATDLLGDRVHHILPLTDTDASKLVRSVRAAPLLFGYRGAAAVDVAALEDLVLRVAQLADDLPGVASLALDPVVVSPSGVTVLSAEVTVKAPRPRADAGPRRLWVPVPSGMTGELPALTGGFDGR